MHCCQLLDSRLLLRLAKLLKIQQLKKMCNSQSMQKNISYKVTSQFAYWEGYGTLTHAVYSMPSYITPQQNLGFAPPTTGFVTPPKRYNQRNHPEVTKH